MADEQPSSSPQTGSSHVTEELNPEIGLLGALAIGVGTMIAAGIFVLSGLAVSNVGAVTISTDGTVQKQMVRIKSQSGSEKQDIEDRAVEYADWMGTKHLNCHFSDIRVSAVLLTGGSAQQSEGVLPILYMVGFNKRYRVSYVWLITAT